MSERLSFLVAGVQKGGTTALYDCLKKQKSLQAPIHKELHFFDDETVLWEDPDYNVLHSAFSEFDGRLRFEATPITIYWPNALERAKRYRPDLKLVLLFRDPIARAFSQWRMETSRGWEDRDFSWCIRDGRARVGDAHRVYSYVERGFYGRQFRRLTSIFDREQILCLTSAAFKQNPEGVVSRILTFIGADPAPDADGGGLYLAAPPSQEQPSAADVCYLRDVFSEDFAAFIAASGLNAGDLSEYPQFL